MRFTRTKATLAAVGLALSLAACGGDSGDDGPHRRRRRRQGLRPRSGTPKELADAGTIKIGVKFDQPGIGYKEPGTDTPTGFDIEMGQIIAARARHPRRQHQVGRDGLRQPRAVPPERQRRPGDRVVLHHRRAPRASSARPAPTT